MYESGSNIHIPTGDNSEWERNLTVSYMVQHDPLKDLSIALRHASSRTKALPETNSGLGIS